MHFRILTTSLLVAAFGAAVPAYAQSASSDPAAGSNGLTQREVRTLLEEQGYRDIKQIQFDDGLWEAHAVSGNGKRLEVKVDPLRGRIYPEDGTAVSRMNKDEIHASLSAQGFSNIRDLKFKDSLWHAEADNSNGRKVELRIDPEDGTIVTARND
ncbi:hypothetical protein ARC78_02190 [Stenotrophomonas pictorum JCM 9942]|uniref:PepSY domain-containing protein n=1 Tax=Stenotrophomonas pictorum JCM 9942 TaxID=1236960 RepID=A0A0R0AAS4_9GAMM|nr:PepSY domain-containing protein [Stenotrophomonas pictorum]KRG37912.1 hypothetical protein ARC78_02190 [Stenotrophomonas pictorum JCM 9942]